MLNYEVDPELVRPLAPRGTEIDFFEGRTYLSLVGFMFRDTRVKGLPIPFHRNFEEVKPALLRPPPSRRRTPARSRFHQRDRPPRSHRLGRPHLLRRTLHRATYAPPKSRTPASNTPGSSTATGTTSPSNSQALPTRRGRVLKSSSSPSTTGATPPNPTAEPSSTKSPTPAGGSGEPHPAALVYR